MLELKSLCKSYGNSFQLGPVSLAVRAGDTIALVGANGAGKSTLFQMLTGNMEPSSGECYLGQEKITLEKYHLKRQMGYLSQNPSLPPWINGLEALNYAASLLGNLGKEHIERMMKYWDCFSFRHDPIHTCSYGMQKRTGLALATLHNPTLLILDEPFSGLDINHTRSLENYLRYRTAHKLTTLVSTHITSYIVDLCSRVFTIQNGNVGEITTWPNLDLSGKAQAIESSILKLTNKEFGNLSEVFL